LEEEEEEEEEESFICWRRAPARSTSSYAQQSCLLPLHLRDSVFNQWFLVHGRRRGGVYHHVKDDLRKRRRRRREFICE